MDHPETEKVLRVSILQLSSYRRGGSFLIPEAVRTEKAGAKAGEKFQGKKQSEQ